MERTFTQGSQYPLMDSIDFFSHKEKGLFKKKKEQQLNTFNLKKDSLSFTKLKIICAKFSFDNGPPKKLHFQLLNLIR